MIASQSTPGPQRGLNLLRDFPHLLHLLIPASRLKQPIRAGPLLQHRAIKSLTMPFSSELKSEKQNQPTDTKMKTPQLLILLVILLQVSAGFPTNTRDKQASWDDVNVVAHGLLQLGQGLKEHVDKTKAQMKDVNARLKSVNSTVAELERRQREQAEALKARGKELEEKERLLGELAEEVRMKVEEVKKQSEDIYSRMDKLEEKLDEGRDVGGENGDHPGVSFIQVRKTSCSLM